MARSGLRGCGEGRPSDDGLPVRATVQRLDQVRSVDAAGDDGLAGTLTGPHEREDGQWMRRRVSVVRQLIRYFRWSPRPRTPIAASDRI